MPHCWGQSVLGTRVIDVRVLSTTSVQINMVNVSGTQQDAASFLVFCKGVKS